MYLSINKPAVTTPERGSGAWTYLWFFLYGCYIIFYTKLTCVFVFGYSGKL